MSAHHLSISTVAFLVGLGVTPALAQMPANDSATDTSMATTANVSTGGADSFQTNAIDRITDRNVNQLERIKQGLSSGDLTSEEASRLMRGEAKIDRLESRALNNGELSAQELERIRHAERAQSDKIADFRHNDVKSDSDASFDKVLANLQRNINQQQRIDRGFDNGSLTAEEVGDLEKGQARLSSLQARASRDGDITAREQEKLRLIERAQSENIRDERHDDNRLASNDDDGSENRLGHEHDHDRDGRDGFRDHDHDRDRDHDGLKRVDFDDHKDRHDNDFRDHDRDHDRNHDGMKRDGDDHRDHDGRHGFHERDGDHDGMKRVDFDDHKDGYGNRVHNFEMNRPDRDHDGFHDRNGDHDSARNVSWSRTEDGNGTRSGDWHSAMDQQGEMNTRSSTITDNTGDSMSGTSAAGDSNSPSNTVVSSDRTGANVSDGQSFSSKSVDGAQTPAVSGEGATSTTATTGATANPSGSSVGSTAGTTAGTATTGTMTGNAGSTPASVNAGGQAATAHAAPHANVSVPHNIAVSHHVSTPHVAVPHPHPVVKAGKH